MFSSNLRTSGAVYQHTERGSPRISIVAGPRAFWVAAPAARIPAAGAYPAGKISLQELRLGRQDLHQAGRADAFDRHAQRAGVAVIIIHLVQGRGLDLAIALVFHHPGKGSMDADLRFVALARKIVMQIGHHLGLRTIEGAVEVQASLRLVPIQGVEIAACKKELAHPRVAIRRTAPYLIHLIDLAIMFDNGPSLSST